jgi:hypothetical protein
MEAAEYYGMVAGQSWHLCRKKVNCRIHRRFFDTIRCAVRPRMHERPICKWMDAIVAVGGTFYYYNVWLWDADSVFCLSQGSNNYKVRD